MKSIAEVTERIGPPQVGRLGCTWMMVVPIDVPVNTVSPIPLLQESPTNHHIPQAVYSQKLLLNIIILFWISL